jgi:cell division septation protein DedD
MEDKKPNNQDDELKPGSSEGNQEESEDFGLPEASSDDDLETGDDSGSLTEPDDSDSDIFSDDLSEDDEMEESQVYKYQATHNGDRQRNPVGLIISFVLIGIIVIAIAIYWFFFREPAKKQIVQRPVVEEVETPQVVEEEPPQETVTEIPAVVKTPPAETRETPAVVEEGSFEAINQPTGRYYVVLNSFIDSDLAEDYAQKLANEGVDTRIIPPTEIRKGFHRVVLGNEYGTWQAAEASLGELKEVFGESIWVLKY